MTPKEMEYVLSTITLITDTREQNTTALQERLQAVGFPYIRQKLDVGDYSAKYVDMQGNEIYITEELAIERKMSIDEICSNFTKGRDRFEREFNRATNSSCKVYLIIENASYEKILKGTYRSKLNSNSLLSSLFAWCDRYNITPLFCKRETTPVLINKIIYHHIRNKLQKEIEI